MPPKTKDEIEEEVTLQVRAVIRRAREAYNESYGWAKVVLKIPEIAEGMKLYIDKILNEGG